MPRLETYYEWDIEYVDEHGEIQDHDHADCLSEYRDDDLKEALRTKVEGTLAVSPSAASRNTSGRTPFWT